MKFGAKKESKKPWKPIRILEFTILVTAQKKYNQILKLMHIIKHYKDRLRSEGNTGKYKGYNVLGVGNIKGEVKPIMGEHVYSEYFINKYVPEQYRVDATTYAFGIY